MIDFNQIKRQQAERHALIKCENQLESNHIPSFERTILFGMLPIRSTIQIPHAIV